MTSHSPRGPPIVRRQLAAVRVGQKPKLLRGFETTGIARVSTNRRHEQGTQLGQFSHVHLDGDVRPLSGLRIQQSLFQLGENRLDRCSFSLEKPTLAVSSSTNSTLTTVCNRCGFGGTAGVGGGATGTAETGGAGRGCAGRDGSNAGSVEVDGGEASVSGAGTGVAVATGLRGVPANGSVGGVAVWGTAASMVMTANVRSRRGSGAASGSAAAFTDQPRRGVPARRESPFVRASTASGLFPTCDAR